MKEQPINHPGVFTRFLWFCSGGSAKLLRQCPTSEHIKYAGIGGTVFFTGLLAALSGGYAFYTIFQSYVWALCFGLLWGLIIFNLDRFIVSTIKKKAGIRRQIYVAIPRLLLAIVLALVISKPLELRIFNSEIDEILHDRRTEKIAGAGNEERQKIVALEEDIAKTAALTEARRQQRENDYADYKCECDGTCGTGKQGRGSECARKEQKYLLANQEYQEEKQNNDALIEQFRAEIIALRLQEKETIQQTADKFSSGLMARISASGELPLTARLFITLLIILIEISPIMAKILSPRGPYDDLLSRVERQFFLEQQHGIQKEKLKHAQEVSLLDQSNRIQAEAEEEQRKALLKEVTKAKRELLRDQVDAWVAEEMKKSNNN